MNSKLGMIYGAAGTGKTRVAEYIAKIFEDKNILCLLIQMLRKIIWKEE